MKIVHAQQFIKNCTAKEKKTPSQLQVWFKKEKKKLGYYRAFGCTKMFLKQESPVESKIVTHKRAPCNAVLCTSNTEQVQDE